MQLIRAKRRTSNNTAHISTNHMSNVKQNCNKLTVEEHKDAMSTFGWNWDFDTGGDSPSIFSSLDKMWNFNSLQK